MEDKLSHLGDKCVAPVMVHLNSREVAEALKLGKTRSGQHNDADTLNSQNYYKELGYPGWWRHFTGALAEVAYRQYTGWEILTANCADGDCGIDFEDGSQVKGTMQNNSPNLLRPVSQVIRMLKKIIPLRYVLGWVIPEGNKLYKVMFLGQISHADVEKYQYIVEKGRRNMKVDTYWVDRDRLCFFNLHHLKKSYEPGAPFQAWPDDIHHERGLI